MFKYIYFLGITMAFAINDITAWRFVLLVLAVLIGIAIYKLPEILKAL